MSWINRINRYVRNSLIKGEFKWFETEVGLKYENGSFSSNEFAKYPFEQNKEMLTKSMLSDLIFPPDMLKNKYSWAGLPVQQTPHFELMQDLINGTLSANNSYLQHMQMGTLDSRMPDELSISRLKKIFESRRKEFLSNQPITVKTLFLKQAYPPKIVILDGKHRVAMALALKLEENINIHFLPNNYAHHHFFKTMYETLLRMPKEDYSQNQALIREIYNES